VAITTEDFDTYLFINDKVRKELLIQRMRDFDQEMKLLNHVANVLWRREVRIRRNML